MYGLASTLSDYLSVFESAQACILSYHAQRLNRLENTRGVTAAGLQEE